MTDGTEQIFFRGISVYNTERRIQELISDKLEIDSVLVEER